MDGIPRTSSHFCWNFGSIFQNPLFLGYFQLFDPSILLCYQQKHMSERAHVFRMDGIPRTSSHFCWKNGFREWNFPKSIVLVQLNARILMCYQYESKYVLKKFTGTQEVGPPRQNQVGKQRFSNLTHTWLTYFLCAHTKNEHIVGLLLVTHRD